MLPSDFAVTRHSGGAAAVSSATYTTALV
jgi:hypothetical protein